ncbi:hypothetical protein BSKO_14016 [Bryopsis sp. KO-2023]|nr:hypothetical protein BSKO_14016 [Bryopsis sp. KO-2023]
MASFLQVSPSAHSCFLSRLGRPSGISIAKKSVRVGNRKARKSEVKASSGEKSSPQYDDSLTDVAFIGLCRRAYGELSGWQSEKGWLDGEETYKGMVEVSRALMKGRSAAEQRSAIIDGFPNIPDWFRKLFPYSKWGAELNAQITPAFFTWLVGPMETVEVEIEGETMKSGVHIQECRYLKESGCTGMCVNLCKAPCQTFFTEQLGMPLTMNPNFEDYSCEMIFGQRPPPLEKDPVMEQGCLTECATAKSGKGQPCWKLD